jgi:hypothetical protein
MITANIHGARHFVVPQIPEIKTALMLLRRVNAR